MTKTKTPSLFSQLPPTSASHSSPAIFWWRRSESDGATVANAGSGTAASGLSCRTSSGSGADAIVLRWHSQAAEGEGKALPQLAHLSTSACGVMGRLGGASIGLAAASWDGAGLAGTGGGSVALTMLDGCRRSSA